ncbi:MAG: class I SAM-dependent methyltransferase [Aureliella sp.]
MSPNLDLEISEHSQPGEDGAGTTGASAEIPDYYNDTVADYDAWSKEGYLHFGYWRPWLNPFRRRPMLEEMNRLIFTNLGLRDLRQGSVADLGCGVGAVARHGSRTFNNLDFHAMTLSAEQVARGKSLHEQERVSYYVGDYHQLPFEDSSIDRIYYLESLCHSTTPDAALAEAARALKPGGKIALTDGYITRPLDETSKLFQHVVRGVAHNWAVPMFHEIELAEKWTGAGNLRLAVNRECGWHLGPSALHAIHLSAWHFVKLNAERFFSRGGVKEWQWKHLTASAYTVALGLYRKYFRYHLLVFEKPL